MQNIVKNLYDSFLKLTNQQILVLSTHWIAIALIFSIPISTFLTNLFAIFYIILLFSSGKAREVPHYFKSSITLSIVLYIIINIAGLISTAAPMSEALQAFKKTSRLLLLPLLMPLFRDIKWQSRALWSFIIAVFLSVIFGYFKFYSPVNFVMESFKDRIYTGSFVAFSVFLLLVFLSERVLSKKTIFIVVILILLFSHYLFFISTGRTGQVLFFALGAVFIFKKISYTPIKLTLIGVMLIILMVCSFSFPRYIEAYRHSREYVSGWLKHEITMPPLSNTQSSNHLDSSIRLEFYARTLKLGFKKPILGWGTGSFPKIYNLHFPERMLEGYPVKNPHNQYLLTFAELGITGLFSLLLIFFSIGCYSAKLKDRFESTVLVGILSFMVVGCMINSWVMDFTSFFFFVCMTAVICAHSLYSKNMFEWQWLNNIRMMRENKAIKVIGGLG